MSDNRKTVTPYGESSSKKKEVESMFDAIAPTYDLLNRGTSFRIDTLWRKKLLEQLDPQKHTSILDVATGTADVAIQAVKKLGIPSVTGIDLSAGMLKIGREKVQHANFSSQIELIQGDCENLPFQDNSFDAVTASFGVRNFENLDRGLEEMWRVLRPGGKIVILEFSRIGFGPLRAAFNFYFGKIMPLIGRLQSKDPRAYSYLFESVQVFPSGKDFTDRLEKAGFKRSECQPLTFGVASLYSAYKPA